MKYGRAIALLALLLGCGGRVGADVSDGGLAQTGSPSSGGGASSNGGGGRASGGGTSSDGGLAEGSSASSSGGSSDYAARKVIQTPLGN
jgi:hypothetical protein